MADDDPTGEQRFDVIVAGGGVAGMTAAISAADRGARVLVLERTAALGGMAVYSGGNLVEFNGEDALVHLQVLSSGKTDDPVLEAYVDGLHRVEPWLWGLGASTSTLPSSGPDALAPCWPNTPGATGVRYYRVDGPSGAATALVQLLVGAVEARVIEVRLETRVVDLIVRNGAVTGVVATGERGESRLSADAVIVTTGGFESAPSLCDAYLPIAGARPIGHQANTGDGLLMTARAGAAVWHMSNFYGGWAFSTPEYSAAMSVRTAEPGSMIVDSTGRRFVAEQGREGHDLLRSLGDYLPGRANYPAWPAWLITDEPGLASIRFGPVRSADGYSWSEDNRAEVERGWIRAAASAPELARAIGADGLVLASTIEDFARPAGVGHDQFGRPFASMRPLEAGPLFALQIGPAVWTTCGGPRRDGAARVLDTDGAPIPGLFAAGGNGSVWGHLTEHGGGLTDGLVFGAIAAEVALGSASAVP